MERIGNRFYVRNREGNLTEVETEWNGYIQIPSLPKGITFKRTSSEPPPKRDEVTEEKVMEKRAR